MSELAALFATTAGTAAAASTATAATAAASTLPWLTAAGSFIGPPTAAASGLGTFSALASGAGSLLSTLHSGLSLASMAGDIFGGMSEGRAASDQLRQQAEQDFVTAKQEELQGLQQQNDISENLRQTIATQRLAYSGAGIDFSFGTPEKTERNLTRQAEMQLATSRDNARLKSLARRRAGYIALSQRSQAQSAPVLAGLASAGRTLDRRLT